jgi:hypothetical protein
MEVARIEGVQTRNAGLFVGLVYWLTRRRLGRLITPVQITAHHPRLLRAVGAMEMGQAAARSVDASLKMLAQIKVAMLVGCPF